MSQSALDIFVIDWESPKMFRHKSMMPKQSVNPWRRLFIVNEFNELQTSRTLNTEWTLLIFLVIAEGFGYRYFSLMEADLTRKST